MKPKKVSLATRAIHGKKLYPYKGAVTTPIYQTSTYRFENSNDAVRYSQGDPSVYVYSRYHNPSVEDVEEKIAEMYDAEAALLFSSGMAAISTAISAGWRSSGPWPPGPGCSCWMNPPPE
jgi:cystathionine beta-lyase/cystathionine gamma-synthase